MFIITITKGKAKLKAAAAALILAVVILAILPMVYYNFVAVEAMSEYQGFAIYEVENH